MSRAEIDGVNRLFEDAGRRKDAAGMAALYTADAIAMPPDGPIVKGRDNIRQMWASAIAQMALTDVKLGTKELEFAGDMACEVGAATLTLEPERGKRVTAAVKYVVVWKKVDGQWRLHRDIWNSMPA